MLGGKNGGGKLGAFLLPTVPALFNILKAAAAIAEFGWCWKCGDKLLNCAPLFTIPEFCCTGAC